LKTLQETINMNSYSTFSEAAKAINECFSNFKERSFTAIRRTLLGWIKDILKNYDEATATGVMVKPKDNVLDFGLYFSSSLAFALLGITEDCQLNKGFIYLNIYYDILGKSIPNELKVEI